MVSLSAGVNYAKVPRKIILFLENEMFPGAVASCVSTMTMINALILVNSQGRTFVQAVRFVRDS